MSAVEHGLSAQELFTMVHGEDGADALLPVVVAGNIMIAVVIFLVVEQ